MSYLPDLITLLDFANVTLSSAIVILAFSLLAYTLTYNFLHPVARWFAVLLACVACTYASEVALNRIVAADSAARWLRFQWLGIALLPAAYYQFSLAVLRATNYRFNRRVSLGGIVVVISVVSAALAMFGRLIVNEVQFLPPISYLRPGILFWPFATYFLSTIFLALGNIWHARQRCLTESTRERMTYLLVAFVAPAMGTFPYLIGLSRIPSASESAWIVLTLSLLVNCAVAFMLVLMSYSVAYFGVLTPDRVVRYRLLRYFFRGPVVAILVILALQTVPKVERLLGLPRDIVLFSVITGVIVLSQLFLSVTKSITDRLVYREDREEIAWLRELDRRLLATSDVRQFLENHLVALCELLRVPSAFVAAVAGPDLILEAVVGPDGTRTAVMETDDWTDALSSVLQNEWRLQPVSHAGYWIWPLIEPGSEEEGGQTLGMLGVRARTEAPLLSHDEVEVLEQLLQSVARVIVDRKLQQNVFVALRTIIPDIDRIQQIRNVVPYSSADANQSSMAALLNPSPIHSPEFEAWVKDALSHYWGGPKLTKSPLVQLRAVASVLEQADGNPTKGLRLVLGAAIERLKPDGKQDLSAPEWLLYNILEMRFIQGRKIREIADRLAISESDLYRKQRVAIGQVARVLADMEQSNGTESSTNPNKDGGPDTKAGTSTVQQERTGTVHGS